MQMQSCATCEDVLLGCLPSLEHVHRDWLVRAAYRTLFVAFTTLVAAALPFFGSFGGEIWAVVGCEYQQQSLHTPVLAPLFLLMDRQRRLVVHCRRCRAIGSDFLPNSCLDADSNVLSSLQATAQEPDSDRHGGRQRRHRAGDCGSHGWLCVHDCAQGLLNEALWGMTVDWGVFVNGSFACWVFDCECQSVSSVSCENS
jgi:hypothetical protein